MKITCGLFLINKEDELLCVHPTNHPIDVWSVPKGIVDENETYLQAAIRETYEETSIIVNTDEHIFHSLDEIFEYKSGQKGLSAHFIFEKENPDLDFNNLDFECKSFVPEIIGGFPEVDSFGWVHISKARHFIHVTQEAALAKSIIIDDFWPE